LDGFDDLPYFARPFSVLVKIEYVSRPPCENLSGMLLSREHNRSMIVAYKVKENALPDGGKNANANKKGSLLPWSRVWSRNEHGFCHQSSQQQSTK